MEMPEQKTELRCDMCGATFRDPDALAKHRQTHLQSEDDHKELEQGTTPPMGDTGLPPAGTAPIL